MGCKLRSAALSACVLLIAIGWHVDWTCAQKTIQRFQSSSNYQVEPSIGSNQNSVYGGYESSSSQSSSRKTALAAPVNQRRTQSSFSSSRRVQQQQNVVQPVYQQQQNVVSSSSSSYEASQQAEADAEPASYGSVNGVAGVDFPNYTRVPKTSFSCEGLPYEYGMYADESTGCQAYHLCYNGRRDSFLCGPGTVFNQRILHCDYWYSVDCGKSSQYWSSNAYMGSSQPEPGPAQASSSYQRTESRQSSSFNRPARVQSTQSSSFNRNVQQVQEAY